MRHYGLRKLARISKFKSGDPGEGWGGLLLSQQNITGSAGSLSLEERVGVRDFAPRLCS